MSAVPKRRLSVAEYLAIENAAETKSEFFNGEMFAMSGASPPHIRISSNLLRVVANLLEDGPCQAMTSDQRVFIPRTGLYTYPDLTVACGELQYDEQDTHALLNPVAVFEVLSPSTENYDRGKKFLHYQTIPTLHEYVLVSAVEYRIDRYVKRAGNRWELAIYEGPDATLVLESPPLELKFKDIYKRLQFEQADSE